MLESFLQSLKDRIVNFLKERPLATFLAALIMVVGFCGGSVLFGAGPVMAIERLFFPARFVYTSVGDAGDWYEVYTIDPPQDYDPDNFSGDVPEALIELINESRESIHVAGFEFDLTPVAEAMIAAHRRGVDVKWFTDDEHGLEADVEDGHGQYQMMIEAGIPVRDDDRDGLMHNKFIVFDEEIVWTGSTNITRNGMFRNNNNVLILNASEIASVYERQFRELWNGKSSSERRAPIRRQTTLVNDTPLMVLFAPEDDAMDFVLPLVKQARESVHFMTFAFTHDELGKELVRQARRGVDVQGVFESRNATTTYSEIHRLYCAGLDVREDGNPANMHHKVFIIDGRTIVTGSYNFSNNSEHTNDENLVMLSNYDIAGDYQEEFERVWAEASPPTPSDIFCP